jgi:hypothetical protein
MMDLGPTAYWKLNETAGSSIFDSSGNTNTGTKGSAVTLAGASSPIFGVTDGCPRFTASTNSKIDFSSSLTINDHSNVTIMGWVKMVSVSLLSPIFSNGRDCCGTYNGYELWANRYTKAVGDIWNGGNHAVYGPALSTDTWYFLATTYDGSNLRIYVNGSLSATSAYTGGVGTPASFAPRIGNLAFSPQSSSVDGWISRVAIFDYAISGGNLLKLYNAAYAPNPLFHYRRREAVRRAA